MRPLEQIEADLDRAHHQSVELAARINDEQDVKRQYRLTTDHAELLSRMRTLEAERRAIWDGHNDRVLRKQVDAARLAQEDATFWFRRFFTTLGIANGAAFAALASGFLQADKPSAIAGMVALPMALFAWGMCTAGLLPLILALRLQSASWLADHLYPERWAGRFWKTLKLTMAAAMFGLAAASMLLLIAGLCVAVWNVLGLATYAKNLPPSYLTASQ